MIGLALLVTLFWSTRTAASRTNESASLPDASIRGNIMYWKVHKVGSSTLREILVRKVKSKNLTLSTLGCVHQRQPSRAHLSASHVICREPEDRRDAAISSLLGERYVEIAFLREPQERALSAYYFVAMSARRTAAVNQAGCAFNISYMQRALDLENVTERRTFAEWGHTALQECALSYSGGNAAHVRVFLPQSGYWAPSREAALQHMRRGVAEGRFFVGLHERYDESLALMAQWLGWTEADVRSDWRKKAFKHPRITDWADEERGYLRDGAMRSGEWEFYMAARELYQDELRRLGGTLRDRL